MNELLLNQLRRQVIADLAVFLPKGCFTLEQNLSINGKELSRGEKWEFMAAYLGNKLCYESECNIINLTPRQHSAAEVLYELGNLTDCGINEPQSTKNLHAAINEPRSTKNLHAAIREYSAYLEERESKQFAPLLDATPTPKTVLNTTKTKDVRGLTKQEIVNAFQGIYWETQAQCKKCLQDVPKWVEKCRVEKGTPGNNRRSSKWDPVKLAIALLEKDVPEEDLNKVFRKPKLREWAEEWKEKTYNV